MKDSSDSIPCDEGPAWADIEGKWYSLYGSFPREGVSIEWHDFATDRDLDWSLSFHDRSLEVCLNFLGEGAWQTDQQYVTLAPKQVALYTGGQSKWQAIRRAGTAHRFITLELAPEYLQRNLAHVMDGVREEVRRFMENPERAEPLLEIQPMGAGLLALRSQLLTPSVSQGALALWYSSKIMEIMAQLFYQEKKTEELFCDRNKRLNKDRVDQASYLLQRDLVNPPSLEMLAKEVNCSPFHLSRIFAQETGLTIPRYLRMLRIEKASELLRQGKGNVTEAAFAVGYSSLSAFNQAFVEITGCCPGLYPARQRPVLPRIKRR
jgi:AraC-like DNA-binding protein